MYIHVLIKYMLYVYDKMQNASSQEKNITVYNYLITVHWKTADFDITEPHVSFKI